MPRLYARRWASAPHVAPLADIQHAFLSEALLDDGAADDLQNDDNDDNDGDGVKRKGG